MNEFEFHDCVDLLFEFNREDLEDENLILEFVLDAIALQIQDIIGKCREIVEEEK